MRHPNSRSTLLIFRILAIALSFFALSAQAGLANPSAAFSPTPYDFSDIADEDVLTRLTTHMGTDSLPHEIRLLVWNVLKGKRSSWPTDMNRLGKASDLILLQEAMRDGAMEPILQNLGAFPFVMAQSWARDTGETSGVATGSVDKILRASWWRTEDREPVVRTPKMTLATLHRLASGELLLVFNIHGINITSTESLQAQLLQTDALIKSWQGPVIFAGDFNTRNSSRTRMVERQMRSWGLTEVQFTPEPRESILDRVYIRGCKSLDPRVLDEVTSSDHFPLTLRLVCGSAHSKK